MHLLLMPICLITEDQGKHLGSTVTSAKDLLLKHLKTLTVEIKFMIPMVKSATQGSY
jgi:hypothetical protein